MLGAPCPKTWAPVLMPDDQDNYAGLFDAIDEQIRHRLERISPSPSRDLGPELWVRDHQAAYSFILVQESRCGSLSEPSHVSVKDLLKVSLGFRVKPVLQRSFARSLANASSPGTR